MTIGTRAAASAPRAARVRAISPRAIALALLIGVVVVTATSVVAAAFRTPLDFDEAYNLQIAQNLVGGHGYATDLSVWGRTGDGAAFDPAISTGPTLLLPVALVMKAFGSAVWVYRLVPVAAYLALIAAAGLVGRRLHGDIGLVTAALGVVAVAPAAATWPASPLYGAGDVLGEFAMAALVTGAALMLHRPRLAGGLIGLAIMTKFVCLLVVPGFILALLATGPTAGPNGVAHQKFERAEPPVRRVVRAEGVGSVVKFVAWLVLPVLAWQVVKVIDVGPTQYRRIENDFVPFLVHAGSGIGAGYTTNEGPASQVALLMHLLPRWIPVLLALGLLTAIARASRAARARTNPLDDSTRRTLVALMVAATTILLWWVFVSSAAYVRHALPAVMILLPAGAAWSMRQLRRRAGDTALGDAARRVAAACLLSGLGISAALHAVEAWHAPGPTVFEQSQVAAKLAEIAPDRTLMWEKIPPLELGVFDRFRFAPVSAGGILVVGPVLTRLDPDLASQLRKRCGEVLINTAHYTACRVAAEPSAP